MCHFLYIVEDDIVYELSVIRLCHSLSSHSNLASLEIVSEGHENIEDIIADTELITPEEFMKISSTCIPVLQKQMQE